MSDTQMNQVDAYHTVFRMARDAEFADALLDALLRQHHFEIAIQDRLSEADDISWAYRQAGGQAEARDRVGRCAVEGDEAFPF